MSFPTVAFILATQVLSIYGRRLAPPEDPFAFPKYRVTFLNSLPLVNDTAEHWLKDGLQGGILEFTDQPWKDTTPLPSSTKEIDSGTSDGALKYQHAVTKPSLEKIKMGPNVTFLCFVPAPLEPPRVEVVSEEAEMSPIRGWQLLQPLAGTCLYYRHGWFTYSYCHDREVRQFKELVQNTPSGGLKIQEDPSWNAYTLGKAPPAPQPGVDLSVAEQNAAAANLELAKGAGSRYLVQRWGDGTYCDLIGKKREVEVQFHCSMDMSDHIALIKETKICSYLVVINTPRLCGEPGFRNPYEVKEEALIRCREVVPNGSLDDPKQLERYKALPAQSSHPVKFNRPQRVISPPPPPPLAPPKSKDTTTNSFQDLFKKALDSMGGVSEDTKVVVQKAMDNGEVIFEVINDDLDEDDEVIQESLNRIFKAAGWDLKKEKDVPKKRKPEEEEEEEFVDRDEL